ncbi:uncharacterized protein LOC105194000 [Solenopsis invicta]|uniref:uncharacterized protein LOC105194000 n=1 Tax=Solenopsis invicta TaxID=13686 RepID=UPI000595E046|nr:uncharacterized protein LOC105194000 [Solenopsis invicta]
MKFLSDMQPEIETVTNMAPFPNEDSNDTAIFDESSSSGCGSRNHKRSCSSLDDNEDSFDRLVDAINQSINVPPFVPPTPTVTDKAALYGNLVATQLREINSQFVDDIMIKVMQLLNDAKKRYPN